MLLIHTKKYLAISYLKKEHFLQGEKKKKRLEMTRSIFLCYKYKSEMQEADYQ